MAELQQAPEEATADIGQAPITPAQPGSTTPSPSKPNQAASRPMTPGLAADAEDIAPKDPPDVSLGEREAAAEAEAADASGNASPSLADALTDIGTQFKGMAGAETVSLLKQGLCVHEAYRVF